MLLIVQEERNEVPMTEVINVVKNIREVSLVWLNLFTYVV